MRIGDFVTSCSAGFWQIIDVKPKIATSDYSGEKICWKKGDLIGQWVILKKAFTPKMKPRIDFEYVDSAWIAPVGDEVLASIMQYFSEHPDYKEKFDNAEVKLAPVITNCWLDLPEDKEDEFRELLSKLPTEYTMDEFWKKAKSYKKCILSSPPAKYLLNLMAYPWSLDEKANVVYHNAELTKR